MDIMKHLAAILQSMGYNIKNNSESSDKSYRSSSVINHPPTDNDEDDDFSAYDEDEVRNDIYELLMKDRSSQLASNVYIKIYLLFNHCNK